MIRYVEYQYKDGSPAYGTWVCEACEEYMSGEVAFPHFRANPNKPFRFCPLCGVSAEFEGTTAFEIKGTPKVIRTLRSDLELMEAGQ